MRAALCLFVVFLVAVNAQATWKDCSQPGDKAKIKSVTLNPAQPVRATTENITITGDLQTVVTGGKNTITITFGGLPVYTQTVNNCDILVCPIQPGTISYSIIIPGTAIPKFSPKGAYIGNGKLTDQSGNELGCIQVFFSLP